jgi:ADP-ribose pyrophosphatase
MSEPEPKRRIIFRGRKIDLALEPVRRDDGSVVEREVVLHRGAVALLVMVGEERVCLVKNGRYAVGKTLLEVPAGTIDPGEEPLATAVRELREETGYEAAKIRRVGEWFVSPGVMNERMHLFLCEDLRPGPVDHQPDERLEPVIVPMAEALSMVADGRIEDAKTMLALLIAQRLGIPRAPTLV